MNESATGLEEAEQSEDSSRVAKNRKIYISSSSNTDCMENININQSEANKDLGMKVLDLFFVPSSMVRFMRDYDIAGGFEGSKVRKAIGYTTAVGFEICRLGVYYTQVLEPLYKLISQ